MKEKDKTSSKIKIVILSILFSIIALIGFIFLARIDYEDIIRYPHFLYTIPFILLVFLYYYRLSSPSLTDKRKLIISLILSFLFALSLIAGYQLRVSIALASGIKGKIGIIIKSIALSFLFIPFFELLLHWSVNPFTKHPSKEEKILVKPWNRILVFFVSWAIILLFWIPVLLAYWPGIMSYDSHRQFNEAYNNIYWELQPIAHTFLIHLAITFGQKIGSFESGVAIYSLLQMILLSGSLAYITSLIYKINKSKLSVLLTLVFYSFLPINSVLSISITKDIIFTAFFLILSSALIERFLTQIKHPVVLDVLIVISGSLMFLFRKNGIYGFALYSIIISLASFLVLLKNDNKNSSSKIKLLFPAIICIIALLVGFSFINIVKSSLKAGNGPASEKYSVIIQQFARISYYHKDELNDEDKIIIERYLPGYTSNPEYYFSLADAPKYNSKSSSFDNTSLLIKDWTHMVINYPEDCIDAYLGLIAGYFFTDDIAISQYLGYGRNNMRGLLETFNALKPGVDGDIHIESVSKLPNLQYFFEGIVSNEEYLKYPIIPILFRPAFYIWIAITCFSILIYKKRYQMLLVSSIQIAYFCTVLLGPVANIRYALQVILAVPLLLTMAFIRYTPALPPVGNTSSSSNTGSSPDNSEK